jgi:hypothetical protein
MRKVAAVMIAAIAVGIVVFPILPVLIVVFVLVALIVGLYGLEVGAAARLVRRHDLVKVTLEDCRRRRSLRDRGWILLFDRGEPLDARVAPRPGTDLYLAGDPDQGRVALVQFLPDEPDPVGLSLLWPSRRASADTAGP